MFYANIPVSGSPNTFKQVFLPPLSWFLVVIRVSETAVGWLQHRAVVTVGLFWRKGGSFIVQCPEYSEVQYYYSLLVTSHPKTNIRKKMRNAGFNLYSDAVAKVGARLRA